MKEHATRPYKVYASDDDAKYSQEYEIDASKVGFSVACPSLPSNVRDAGELSAIDVDQVVIGSCTNGRLEDLEMAAAILAGKKVSKGLRCIVIPATPAIYGEAMRRGYFQTFLDAGCIISPPTCGPCLGGHMGILAKGERAVATTNRNFIGRMGHPESEVYLVSPAVAAATAVAGALATPEKIGVV